jgi:hypothetical protein
MPFISLKLGKSIDESAFHVCFVLWALGEMDLEDADLRQAAVTQLETTAKVALSTAIVLACPRKTYKSQDARERMLNPLIFGCQDWRSPAINQGGKGTTRRGAGQLSRDLSFNGNKLHALLVYNILSDHILGHRGLAHFQNSTVVQQTSTREVLVN